MAQRLKVPPTKSALLQLKRQISFLEQGHELLERKRELLTRVVYERLKDYRALRKQVHAELEDAYSWLAMAQMRMGSQRLRQAAIGLEPVIDVSLLPCSSVGVEYPAITAKALPLKPVGLMWTDPSFDQAREKLRDTAVLLAKLGEAETALWRLLKEQRKTQKRVNALKYNVIPRYRDTLSYIESMLEEEERNTLFQIQVLRRQQV